MQLRAGDACYRRVHDVPIEIGQILFLRNGVQGRNKIHDALSSTPRKVTELPLNNGAVYTVEHADGGGDP